MVNVGGKYGSKFFKGTNQNTIKFSFLSEAKVNSFILYHLNAKLQVAKFFIGSIE